jgi:hypothetical protein
MPPRKPASRFPANDPDKPLAMENQEITKRKSRDSKCVPTRSLSLSIRNCIGGNMVLDLFWQAGEVLSIAALPGGGCLVLIETVPFLDFLPKKSAYPLSRSRNRPPLSFLN